jgi:hypothetical protein
MIKMMEETEKKEIQFEFETENEADKFAKSYVERKEVVAATVSFNHASQK